MRKTKIRTEFNELENKTIEQIAVVLSLIAKEICQKTENKNIISPFLANTKPQIKSNKKVLISK